MEDPIPSVIVEKVGDSSDESASDALDNAIDDAFIHIQTPASRTGSIRNSKLQPVMPPSVELTKVDVETIALQEAPLPKKIHSKPIRDLEYFILDYTVRVVLIVFLGNLSGIIYAAVNQWTIDTLSLWAVANLFCCCLVRYELFLKALFWICVKIGKLCPIFVRVVLTEGLLHIGGFHIGFAFSTFAWFLFVVIKLTMHTNFDSTNTNSTTNSTNTNSTNINSTNSTNINSTNTNSTIINSTHFPYTIVFAYLILVTVLMIMVFAIRFVRTRYHNYFERMHRYMGWSSLAFLWIEVFLLTYDTFHFQYEVPTNSNSGEQTFTGFLIVQPTFWLTVAITCLIITPWLFVRYLPIEHTVTDKNLAIVLKFPLDSPEPGLFGRIHKPSWLPIWEWHAFAVMSPKPGIEDRHMMICVGAGNWTKDLIEHPVSHLFVRRIRTPGFMYNVRMFKRVVLLATGGGIAPILPYVFHQEPDLHAHILWIARNPESMYGAYVSKTMADYPHKTLWDTAKQRPNTLALAFSLVKKEKAEALFVVSNEELTRRIVHGLRTRGIPSFGAIWDS